MVMFKNEILLEPDYTQGLPKSWFEMLDKSKKIGLT